MKQKIIPKKRGRPKGSKNKTKKLETIKKYVEKKIVKKVKKVKAKLKRKPKRSDDISRVKISRFLGYCPKGHMIAARDKRTPRTFICAACGKKFSTNKLKQTMPESKKPLNKKEYLSNLRATGEIRDNTIEGLINE